MPTLRQPLVGLAAEEYLDVGSATEASAPGDLAAGDSTSTLLFTAASGELLLRRDSGAKLTLGTFSELLTIVADVFTDTASTIPANAMVLAVSVRVVTVIPGTSNFTVNGALGGGPYIRAGSVSSSAGSTDPGNNACPQAPASSSATSIRITPDTTPSAGTGEVRIVAYWWVPTAPTA